MADSIIIRHAEKSDVPQFKELYEGPHIVRQTLQLPHPILEVWEQRAESWGKTQFMLAAIADKLLVGHLGIGIQTNPRRRHSASIGLAVHERFLRKGFGSKLMAAGLEMCDDWLNVRRIELIVYTDNEPAIALYKKFCFSIEGEMKCFAFRDGAFVDAYQMARVKTEHETHPE